MKRFLLYLLFSRITGPVFFLLIFFSIRVSAQLQLNEIQTANNFTVQDEYKNYDDWIELHNAGSNPINLLGYGLSDDSTNFFKFRFPAVTMPPDGYLLLFASGKEKKDIDTHWETAVNCSDLWSYRVNTSAPAPADSNWRSLLFNQPWLTGPGGIGWGDNDDATYVQVCISVFMRKTFTIPDTSKILEAVFNMDYDDGFVAYMNGVEFARVNVGIKNVLPDWNAIAPASHEAVMYQGQNPDSFHLDKNLLRSLLRNGTNVLAIETHNQSASNSDFTSRPWLSFLVRNGSSFFGPTPSWFHAAPVQYLHTNFKLSSSGEKIVLRDSTGLVIDSMHTGIVATDHSIYRNADGSGNWCITNMPTPGVANPASICKNTYASIPLFSIPPGFYAAPQTLVLTTTEPGGIIRYSIDGSDISDTSPEYSVPLHLDTTVTVRARVYTQAKLPGPEITNTYFIGLNVTLPVYSLTTDPVNLWDYYTGIFVLGPNAQTPMPYYGANYWQNWEKPATLEYYNKDKQLDFKFNTGIKITGGWSRTTPQKSIEITLGDRYGTSKLNYPLEPLKPWITAWSDFILHDMGTDRGYCHMRDPLMERLLQPTHVDYLAYEPCLLFINGQQWGVYYTRENDDDHYISHNYGYSSGEIDLLKESYEYPTIEVKKGNDSAFWAMYQYAMNSNPSDTGFYNTMNAMMDLENMADYFIAETYYPNNDWMDGINNNLKLWRPRQPGGRFRYISYDLDFGLGLFNDLATNMLAIAMNPTPHNYNADLFNKLCQNPDFRQYFINRYADLMNTIFLPQHIESMAYMFRDELRHDMHMQFEKWGGGDTNSWKTNIAGLVNFAYQRPANARSYVQQDFSLTSQVILTLDVQPAGAGRIEISTISPETYPWSGTYYNGNPVTITAIPNPGYTFDHWQSNVVIGASDVQQRTTYNFTSSDVITCYFTGSPAPVQLTFSEINYNSDSISNAGDWIELHNSASSAIDISNWKFRDEQDNHTFDIPLQTNIPANGYLVISSDLIKFHQIHPSITNVIGGPGFDFSNNGETLRLFNQKDSIVLSATYSDQLPWPAGADGGGFTLELRDASQSLDDGNNWFAGCLNGSPGRAYAAPAVSVSTNDPLAGCFGNTVHLNATASAGSLFQWQRDQSDIPGASAAAYLADSSGSYTVRVTNNGCSAVSGVLDVRFYSPGRIDTVISSSHCGAGSLELTAHAAQPISWFADPAGSVLLDTGSVFHTPPIASSTSFYVQATGACPGPRLAVRAQINPVTATPAATDVSRCGSGTITLTAVDTSALIRWYDADSGGNLLASGSVFTSPSLTATTTYYVEAGSDCPSARVEVHAVIRSVIPDPVVQSGSVCGGGTITLYAFSDSIINWYDAPGGNWLSTGSAFTTPVLTISDVYYAIAGTSCPSAPVAVQAIVRSRTPDPVVQSNSICGPGAVVLTAASDSIVNWYDVPGGNWLGSGPEFSIPFLSTNAVYYAVAGTVCPSSAVPVAAFVLPLPVVNLGNDTVIESGNPLVLDADVFNLYSWSTGDSTRTISVSSTGIYEVTVTNANGCSGTDLIEVAITTGTGTIPGEMQMEIYPNPATTQCRITIPQEAMFREMQLINANGQTLICKDIHPGVMQTLDIDLSKFSKGIYLIRFSGASSQSNYRIFIQ